MHEVSERPVMRISESFSTQRLTVDSKKLEHGPRMIYAGFPSSLGFGIRR